MRITLRPSILGLSLLILSAATSRSTEDWVRYDAQPGSKVQIEGTSTVHDWTMESRLLGGYLELASGVLLDTSQATLPGLKGGEVGARVSVNIPVRSLKSGKSVMDDVMQEAMKEPAYKRIEYRLSGLTLKPKPHTPGTPFEFEAKGTLAVAGVTNKLTMDVTIDRMDKNRLKISGKTPLKMTDFGVKPPAPMLGLGLVKTSEDITITFEWITELHAAPKSNP